MAVFLHVVVHQSFLMYVFIKVGSIFPQKSAHSLNTVGFHDGGKYANTQQIENNTLWL